MRKDALLNRVLSGALAFAMLLQMLPGIPLTVYADGGEDSAAAAEAAPTEPKPTEAKPTEPKPTEAKPTEPKPTEPKPTEPKPAETEAPEVQPTEIKVTEPKETAAPAETLPKTAEIQPTESVVETTDGICMLMETEAEGFTLDGVTLKINGHTAGMTPVSVKYGERLSFSLDGYDGGYHVGFEICKGEDDDWRSISNSDTCSLTPGEYYIAFYIDIPENYVADESYTHKLRVEKGTLPAPGGLKWQGSEMHWEQLPEFYRDAVAGYTLQMYKDGKAVEQIAIDNKSTTEYLNITNAMPTEHYGAGTYSFAVQALLDPDYAKYLEGSSVFCAPCGGYSVPTVHFRAGNGIESVSPASAVLIPGAAVSDTASVKAVVRENYAFDHWEGKGVTFTDPASAQTQVTAQYGTGAQIEVTAIAADSREPQNLTLEAQSGGVLKGTAEDNEDGVAAYVFSTSAAAPESGWASVEHPAAGSVSFTWDLAAHDGITGEYYFHAKDGAGNTASVGKVAVTKILLESVGSSAVCYQAGSKVALPQPADRIGWIFTGWYADAQCSGEPVTSANYTGSDVTLYAGWQKEELQSPQAAAFSHKVYDGSPIVINAGVANRGVTYQWAKYDEASGAYIDIAGATGAALECCTVAESGKYKVTVCLDYGDGDVAQKTQSDIAVEIERKLLEVTADPQRISYGDEAPEYTFTYQTTGFNPAEITEGTAACDYRAGDPAKDYTITLSGFAADNYTFQLNPGKLTVAPRTENITASLSGNEFDYVPNEEIRPDVTVLDSDEPLVEGIDYTLEYRANMAAGEAVVIVHAQGNYAFADISLPFTIKPIGFAAEITFQGEKFWLYGDTAPEIGVSSNPGSSTDITYYYAQANEEGNAGSYTTEAPKNAGSYLVYAVIGAAGSYTETATAPVAFTIAKRHIILEANSAEFDYDGMPHSDAGYKRYEDDGFARGEGFSGVTVSGTATAVTDEEGVPNVVEYTLTSITNPDNYDIEAINGKLVVHAVQLPKPAKPQWDPRNPGTATWVHTSKKGLVSGYEVTLYAVKDGTAEAIGVYPGAGGSPLTDNAIDLSEAIRAHAVQNNSEYTYAFTVQTYPESGENAQNYLPSESTALTGSLKTGKLVLNGASYLKAIDFAGSKDASRVLLQGERVSVRASLLEGYRLDTPSWKSVPENALSVAVRTVAGSADFEASITLSNALTQSLQQIDFHVNALDDHPRVLSYTASNTENREAIELSFTLEDEQGLAGWMITTEDAAPGANDSGWVSVRDGENYPLTYQGSKTISLQDMGTDSQKTFYLYVKDRSGNVAAAYMPTIGADGTPDVRGISLYTITLEPGDAASDLNRTVRLLKAQNIPVAIPQGLYSYPGYAFRHWADADETKVFSDGSNYSENAPAVLTAFWTDKSFDYTVRYFYMDVNGRYADETGTGEFPFDTEKTFNVMQNTTVHSSDSGIQLQRLGFYLDAAKADELTIVESAGDAQQVLKVYYAREQYDLTLSWTFPEGIGDIGGDSSTQKTQKFYYGADISDFCAPKVLPGYQFAGWFFGDAGSQPETMPAGNVTGTGYFRPLQTTYHVRFYTENLPAGEGPAVYTEDTALRQDIAAEHGEAVAMNSALAPEMEGFTYSVSAATFGSAAGAVCPDTAAAELNTNADASRELYINVYYTRNTYKITLNVWKGSIGSGEKVFTAQNWNVLYGDVLPEGVENYHEEGQEEWLDLTAPENAQYVLLDNAVWSTGSSRPAVMPAGDVVVSRQYVRNTNGEYRIEVWVETEEIGHYAKQTFNYSDSVGANITVGNQTGDTVRFSDYISSIAYLEYYDVKQVADEDVGTTVLPASGYTIDGGSLIQGSVTDTNNGEDPLVLRIFFERRTMTATIRYYAIEKDHRTQFATATKRAKWGADNCFFYDPLALFEGTNNQHWNSEPDSLSITAKQGINFLTEGYVAAFNGYYICQYNKPQWTGASFDSVESLTLMQASPDGHQAAKNVSAPMGYDNTSVDVFYTKPDPAEMYTVQVVYNPKALTYESDRQVDVTHKVNGTTYRVYLANEAMFHEDWSYVNEAYAGYPGLGLYNLGGTEDAGRYVYSDTIRSQYGTVEENGHTYYTEGDIIYIPVASNPFYIGRRSGYTFGGDDIGYNDCVLEFLKTYKKQHEDDLEAAGSAVYNRSFGSTVIYKTNSTPQLEITFIKGDVYQLSFSLNGNICKDASHRFGAGTEITVDQIQCSHCQSLTGHEVHWYTDPACTKPVQDFKITGNTTVFGKYEKCVYQNKQYGYFELPEKTAQGALYITNPAAHASDEKLTKEESDNLVVYRYDGHIAIVEKTVPTESFSPFSMTPGDFDPWLETGLYYDASNGSNHLSEYCEDAPIALRAYFARKRVSLTVDPNFEEGKAVTTQYSAGQQVTLADPERPGYVFAGWDWYVVSAEQNAEPTPPTDEETGLTPPTDQGTSFPKWEAAPAGSTVTMPDFHLKAVAKWTAGSFEQTITHYFQNANLSFATEAVAGAQGGESVTLRYGGSGYTGQLHGNGLISVARGMEVWYFTGVTYDDGTGAYAAEPEDLAAIVVPVPDLKQDQSYPVSDYVKQVAHYNFAYALQEYKGVISPRLTDTFENKYGMELNYYYTLVDNIGVSVAGYKYDLEGKNAETTELMTLLGAGSHFYGERVNISAAVPAGYDFLGWYDAAKTAPGGHPVTADKLKDPLNAEGAFGFAHKVTGSASFAAFLRPQPVAEPSLTVQGVRSITYGSENVNNSLTVQVTFPAGTPDTNYVQGYCWKLIAESGEEQVLGTSASFEIPSDWPVGTYRLVCEVTVARKDNLEAAVFSTEPVDVVIDPAALNVSADGYVGDYDASEHGITVDVQAPADGSTVTIYYSTEPMTSLEEALSKGSTDPVTQKNVRAVEQESGGFKAEPYTVYYYVNSGSDNYRDTFGSQTILINPVTVSLKAGTAAYHKQYDGKAAVQGDFDTSDSDFHRLVFGNQGAAKVYEVVGILPGDRVDMYIIRCNAAFNSRHVSDASVVTIRNIVLANRSDNSVVHNYVFEQGAECDLSGYIDPMPVTLEWTDTNLTYTGGSQGPQAVLPTTEDGEEALPAEDRGHLTVNVNGAQISANSYFATAAIGLKPSDEADYTQIKDFSITNPKQQFTIGRVPIKVSPISNTFLYDGKYHNLEAKIAEGSVVSGDTCVVTVPDAQKQKNAGTYTITVTEADVAIRDVNGANVKGNYAITCEPGELKIEPLKICVSGLSVVPSKTYDGTTKAEAILSGAVFTTLDGKSIPDQLSLKAGSVTAAYENADAGTGKTVTFNYDKAQLDGDASGNYELVIRDEAGAEVSQLTTTADITAAQVTVRFKDTSVVYGEQAAFTAEYQGFLGTDTAETVIPGGAADAQILADGEQKEYTPGQKVGTYPIAAVVHTVNAGNYSFVAAGQQGTLEVTPRPLAVAAAENQKPITKTYDGTANVADGKVTPDYYVFTGIEEESASGPISGDSLALTFSAAYNSKDVGEGNAITLTGLSIDSSNYKLVTQSIQVPGSITKASLQITGKEVWVTYGSADVPAYDVIYSGFVNNETEKTEGLLSGTLDYSDTQYQPNTPDHCEVKDGGYTYMPAGLTSNNYEIEFMPGMVKVKPAVITVTAKLVNETQKYRTYGRDPIPELKYEYTGLVNGDVWEDAVEIKDGQMQYLYDGLHEAELDGQKVIDSVPRTYTITPNIAKLTSRNYTFAAEPCKVEVGKNTLTVKDIELTPRVYDGTDTLYAENVQYGKVMLDGLLSFDLEQLQALSADKSGWFTVSGTYRSKNASAEKIPVDLTVTPGTYLHDRYEMKNTQTTADGQIDKRPMWITAEDKETPYSVAFDKFTVVYGKEKDAAGKENANSGPVNGEYAGNADVQYDCTYTAEPGNCSVTTEVYPITPRDFSSTSTLNADNYEITYIPGKLTVQANQFAAPEPVWQRDTPGKVTWQAAASVGDFSVQEYTVELLKGGTVVKTETVAAGSPLECSFADFIHTHKQGGAGSYDVRVQAISESPKNVQNSDWGMTAAPLYAAVVTAGFAEDAQSQAGRGENDLTVGGASSIVKIAGESLNLSGSLKNSTGYRVKTVTPDPSTGHVAVTGGVTEGATGTVDASIELKQSLNSAEAITIVVSLEPLPAQKMQIQLIPSPAEVIYGYGESPVVTAIITPLEGETIPDGVKYVYSYDWGFRVGSTTTTNPKWNETDSDSSTDTWIFPLGQPANNAAYYTIRCGVTVKRTDNGQTYVVSKNSGAWTGAMPHLTNIKVNKADFTAKVDMDGWTYGALRNSPVLTVTPKMNADENSSLNSVVYSYAPAGDDGKAAANAVWTEWNAAKPYPTNAGSYVVSAFIPASVNYNEVRTQEVPFTIAPAKLDEPQNLRVESGDGAYAVLKWGEVHGPVENAGISVSASGIDVTYDVELFDPSGAKIGTYTGVQSCEQDVTGLIQNRGVYRFTVTAVSSNQNNCKNSDPAEETIDVTAKIHAEKISKVYDAQPIVLSVENVSGSAYQWFKGTKLAATSKTLNVTTVADSGTYTCVVTADGKPVITQAITVTIDRRPVTVTGDGTQADPVVKVYNGSAQVDDGYAVELQKDDRGMVTGQREEVSYAAEGINASETLYRGSFTSVRFFAGSVDVTDNYSIATVDGYLRIDPRQLNTADFAVEDIADVIYNANKFTPTPKVTDRGLQSGGSVELAEGKDFFYEYEKSAEGAANPDNTWVSTDSRKGTVTIAGRNNYTGSITVTFDIQKRPVQLVAQGTLDVPHEETYTGRDIILNTAEAQTIEGIDESGLVDGHECEYTYSAVGRNASETSYAGSFTDNSIHILANGTDVTENYAITPVVGYLKILPATLTVKTESASKVYNGTALTAPGSIEGFVNGEHAPFRVTGSQTSAAPGSNFSTNTYEIDWDSAEATAKRSNYTIHEELGTLTVSEYAGEILVQTTGGTFPYDGKVHQAQVTVTGLPEGYRAAVAESDDQVTHVVDGPITANCDHLTILNAHNEDVTNRLNIKRENDILSVTPKTLQITTQSDSRPYNGQLLTAQGSISGIVAGETYSFEVTGGQLDFGESTNTYSLIFKAEGNAYTAYGTDYSISENLGTLNVTKVTTPIIITANSKSKVYDGTPLTDDGYTCTEGVLVEGDELIAVVDGTITDYIEGGAANTVTGYRVVRTRDGKEVTGNYTFRTPEEGTLTITRRPVQITAGGTQDAPLTHRYDGKPYVLHNTTVEQSGDNRGILAGHTAEVDYTISGTDVQSDLYVGTYGDIVIRDAKGADVTNNYTVEAIAGYLRIDPITAQIIITANSKSKVYDGTPLTDGGYTYTNGVLLEGDVLTAVVQGTITDYREGGAANTVTGYVVSRGGQNITSNYTITTRPGTLEIIRREMTLYSDSDDKVYNGTPLTNHAEHYDGDPFVSGEGVTWAFSGTITDEGRTENRFTYTANEGTNPNNYIIHTRFGELRIDPKPVKIIVANSTKTYGNEDPEFLWSLDTALIHVGDLGTISGYRTNDAERVGVYNGVLSAHYTNNHNYSVTIQKGNFEITASDKMNLTVTPLKITYDGQKHGFPAESNITNGTTFSYSMDNGENWSEEVPQIQNKGTVTVLVKAENHNYVTATATYTLTVDPAPVLVKPEKASKIYGDSDPKLTAKVTGMVNGEKAEDLIEYELERDEGEKKGTYEIRVICEADQGNYVVRTETEAFNIQPKAVTLKWSDDAFTYNGAKHNVTAVVTNPVDWDGKTDEVWVSAYSGDLNKVNVGNYTTSALELTGKDADNYTLIGADASHKWKITPRDLSDPKTSDGYAVGITVDDISSVIYNGRYHTPGVTVWDDLKKVGGEKAVTLKDGIDYTLSYSDNRNAGTATVTIKGIGNYTGSITKTFEIRRRPVQLIWGNGVFSYDATEHKVTATIANAVAGDDIFIDIYTGNLGIDAGDYTAEAIQLGGRSVRNYTLIGGKNLTFQWRINPAVITITADDQSTVVGEPLAELTYTVTGGQLYGEDVLSGFEISTTAKDEAGTYPITITVTDESGNPNYTIRVEDGTYTLTEPVRIETEPEPETEPKTGADTENQNRAPGDPCWIHWLIVLTDLIYAVFLLLTAKKREEDSEEEQEKVRRSSARSRWIGEILLAVILIVLIILGHCWIELPLSIVSAVLVSLANYGAFRMKFRETKEEPV